MIHLKHRGAASLGSGGIHSGGYVVLNAGWTERSEVQPENRLPDQG